ncbi:MAG: hypothetical protein JO028_13590, partial [Acidobacteriaceae bacterium]|nr:hypothetical protein [Acidobacteriaceae bacterium]
TTYMTAQGLPDNHVPGITGDEAGHVWVLAHTSIAQWQESDGRFVKLTLNYPKGSYRPLLWEGDGFWAPDLDCLHLFLKGRPITYALPSWPPASSLRTVAQDRAGTVWLETLDGKHFRIADGQVQREPSATDSRETPFPYRDRQGALVPLVTGGNLNRFILCVSPSDQVEKIIFTSLFEDREGNLWLGSDGRGLYRLRRQIITVYSREQNFIDNVYPIFQDHTGAIWIGAWWHGLNRFQNGKFTNYRPRNGAPSELTTALTEDRDGRLWVAGEHGLRIFWNGHFQEPVALRLPEGAYIQAMQQDREGAFWFGTTMGLVRDRNGTCQLFTVREGLAGNDIHVLVESAAGDLWMGGSGGVTRLRNGRFTRWTEHDGLPSGIVRSIYIDSEGVVWIGTYDGGLGRLQNNKLTRYTTHEGLFNNGVFQILEDAYGYFWMSCNRGIYRVNKRELNEVAAGLRSSVVSVPYGRSDGMRNVECNGGLWPAGIKARDGTLWFPTQAGAAVVDPALVHINPQPPPVIIESAFLEGATLPLNQALRVKPGKDNLEIRYTALSFVRSGQIQFKYKLEGLESAWVDAGPRRVAYYSHPPPGDYTFRVIARNSDGVWNNQGASLSVRVLAPFYRTWWFQFLALSCAVALVWRAWRYRVSQLERAGAVQRAFSSQLIASQESERKRIAAELHDSLGQRLVLLKNLALFSLRAPEKTTGSEWVNFMQKISDEAALAIEETRQISYNLRPFQLDRLGLTRVIEGMIRTVSAASGMPIFSQLDNIDDAFPEELRINFYRIIQECLNNLLKHAHASQASVRIRRSEGCVFLTVEDDGRGFTPGSYHADTAPGGFGLTGMAERARLLGGEMTVQSEPGNGTIITVAIRYGEKYRDRRDSDSAGR